jgi:hypothetical protein
MLPLTATVMARLLASTSARRCGPWRVADAQRRELDARRPGEREPQLIEIYVAIEARGQESLDAPLGPRRLDGTDEDSRDRTDDGGNTQEHGPLPQGARLNRGLNGKHARIWLGPGMLKVLGWAVLIIFIIGLLFVFGFFKLIF